MRLFFAAMATTITMTAASSCFAQQVMSGIGNSTVIESGTQADPYGITGNSSAIAGDVMATRHRPTGHGSGIGGSFMGTTSVTSETRPVGEAAVVVPVNIPETISLGDLTTTGKNLFSQRMMASPAILNPQNLPSFPAMTVTNVLKQQTGIHSEQPNLSLLMNKLSKHYELTVDQPSALWDSQKYNDLFGF